MAALTKIGIALALACGVVSQAAAQITIASGNTYNLPAANTSSIGCVGFAVAGTAEVAGTLRQTGDFSIAMGGVVDAPGLIEVGGNLSNAGTFNALAGTVALVDGCSAAPGTISGNFVFSNLTLTSNSGRTFVIGAGADITVNGVLTLQGTPGQPITVTSQGGAPAVIRLGPGASVSRTNVIVAPSVAIGSGPVSIPTLSHFALFLLSITMAGAMLLRQHRVRRTP